MSTQKAEIQSDLAFIKRQKKLSAAIQFHKNDIFLKALEEGADVHQFPDDGETNLITAIQSDNWWAFIALLERGVDVRQRGSAGLEPLIVAAAQGNEPMVAELLKRIPREDHNLYSGNNALGYAIGGISSHILEKLGRWSYGDEPSDKDDPSLHQEVSLFYKQTGDYTTAKAANPVPFNPKDKRPIRVYLKDHRLLLGLLLNAGVRPSTFNSDNLNALMVLENPSDPKHIKYFHTDVNYKFVSGKGHLLTFKFQFENHSRGCPFEILVDRDVSIAQEMVFAHHNAHKDDRSEANVQGMAHAIQHKLHGDLTIATAHLAQRIDHVDEKVASEAKRVAELRTQVAPVLAQHWTEASLQSREQAIAKHPRAETFRSIFNTKLKPALSSSIELSSKLIKRTEDTLGDKASDALAFIGAHVPFGFVVSLVGKGVKRYTDLSEEEKFKAIATVFEGDIAEAADLSRKLSIRLTEHCQFLNCDQLASKEAEKLAEKIAAHTYLAILKSNKRYTKSTQKEEKEAFEHELFTTITTQLSHDALKPHFETYLKTQADHPHSKPMVTKYGIESDRKKRSSDNKSPVDGASPGEAVVGTAVSVVLAVGAELAPTLLGKGYAAFKAARK